MVATVYNTESQEEEVDREDLELEQVREELVWRPTELLLPVETVPVIPVMALSTPQHLVMSRLVSEPISITHYITTTNII